jgi:hypothetical protein
MDKLYRPVLEHIYEVPVIGVQVFKNIKAHVRNPITDIMELIRYPNEGIYNWHFTP